jgi:replication factor C subunit 3/5
MSAMDPQDPAQSLPWVEKYRPKTLDDLVSQEDIVSTLNKLIDSNRLPHLLFYGPPGTGKTSTILAATARLFGSKAKAMTLELNASDDRGIGVVRDQIKEFAGTKKLFSSGSKLIILDEADAMTNDAQAALRRVIEKYSANTRFCLICNYVNKITPALQSRCTRFRFSPLSNEQVRGRVGEIIAAENVTVTPDGLNAVLRLGKGDMRRILNVLQATAVAYPEVNEASVYLCTGNVLPQDADAVTKALVNEAFSPCVDLLRSMVREKGYAIGDILTEVADRVMRIEFPPMAMACLLDELSNLEYRLATGTNEQLQLASLVSAFTTARESMGKVLEEQRSQSSTS